MTTATPVKDEERLSEEDKDDENIIHASCKICYPIDKSDYIISLCGVLKPDDRPPQDVSINDKRVCFKCRELAVPHAISHGF